MPIKQVWVNLPVADTARTAAFYTALGFKSNGKPTPELASFFFGEQALVIHFFRADKLAQAAGGGVASGQAVSGVMFSLSATTEAEAKQWAEKAGANGGTVIKEAAKQADGFYYCVFADPDGHRFNALLIEPGM